MERPELLTIKAVAAMLSVSESLVKSLVRRGELPRPRKVGGKAARWFTRDVLDYLAWLRSQNSEVDLPGVTGRNRASPGVEAQGAEGGRKRS